MKPRENEPRIEYLARVLYQFVRENEIVADQTMDYDDAECDAYCLAQDFIDELDIDVD